MWPPLSDVIRLRPENGPEVVNANIGRLSPLVSPRFRSEQSRARTDSEVQSSTPSLNAVVDQLKATKGAIHSRE